MIVPLLLLASVAQTSDSWNELALRRAIALWYAGEPGRAVDVLDAREGAPKDPTGARGDFLRAYALHARGERTAFRESTETLVQASHSPEWARVLAPLVRIDEDPAGVDPAKMPAPPAPAPRPDRTDARTAGLDAALHARWDEAYGLLTGAERRWSADGKTLEELRAAVEKGDVDAVWRAWRSPAQVEGGVALDRSRLETLARGVLDQALDLRMTPRAVRSQIEPQDFVTGPAAAPLPDVLRAPRTAERRALGETGEALAVARGELGRQRRLLADEQAERERLAAYRDLGAARAERARQVADSLATHAFSLLSRSTAIAATLANVRDVEMQRIDERMADLQERARRNRLVAGALRRFRLEGPQHHAIPPGGLPDAAALLLAEDALGADLQAWFDSFATRAPELVQRSHDLVWRPRVVDGPRATALAARTHASRARALGAALAAARDAGTTPAREEWLLQLVAQAQARVDSLAARHNELHLAIARNALADAVHRHRAEGEGIAYALAVTAHERAADSADPDAARDRRGEAAVRYADFLDDFPASRARSEIRFRLADVRLQQAHDELRTRVATFLQNRTDASAADAGRLEFAPFVDYDTAMPLYLAILRDDPDWVHRDAALYEAGMILSERADPRGTDFLQELVTSFPASRHAPSAHLRLGDALFEQGQWAECLPHYEETARTADPERAAIARYRIAWATFAQDRFDESARATVALLDHYAAYPEAATRTDLRDEAMDHLVHVLARGGGADAFSRLVDDVGPRPWENSALANLGSLLRDFSLFDDAAACDSLRLERWPLDAGALDAAARLIEARQRADRTDGALAVRLELAPRFRNGSPWSVAQTDSVRGMGDAFALAAYRTVALHHHARARESARPEDWRSALTLYDTLVDGWAQDDEAAGFHYYAGEAAVALGEYAAAVDHFETAAGATDAPFAVDAAWHAVATRDARYESTGDETHARDVVAAAGEFVRLHPGDARAADLAWRRGSLAYEHGWRTEAADALADFVTLHPVHPAALNAARLRGQALYELEQYDDAGAAWEVALGAARAAGADSVALEIEPLLPNCAYRHAEQRLAATGRRTSAEAAALFDDVATRWPGWEHADQSLYRAGLAWEEASRAEDAVRSWSALADRYADSAYARDALLKVAGTWERENHLPDAASAYRRFARAFPGDADAPSALLTAADLLQGAGADTDAEATRDEYLKAYPSDTESAFAILEPRARRELAQVSADQPVSRLLETAAGKAPSWLRRYVDLAASHDSLASTALLAEVRFVRGEEARIAFGKVPLTQPLEPSIERKKALLDDILREYGASSAYAVVPWNRAAAYRIGECLVAFGDALMESERPADLEGDDLLAYEEVLENRSWDFWDRGEETWTGLVRHAADSDDEWSLRASAELWPRIAKRFVHRPELEHPVIHAAAPGRGNFQ